MKAPMVVLREAAVVLVVALRTCTFHATAGRCSSASAITFTQCRWRLGQELGQQQARPQQQEQRQPRAQVVKQDRAGEELTSTCVSASNVRRSGPRCSTMVGAR